MGMVEIQRCILLHHLEAMDETRTDLITSSKDAATNRSRVPRSLSGRIGSGDIMDLTIAEFQQVDLGEEFFDSLKADYAEFEAWFAKKATNTAYIHRKKDGALDGFLYLKIEEGEVTDVQPPLKNSKRLKVGTFKIEAHGTKLGDRFVKKIFDHAIHAKVDEIYVTVFAKHTALINLLGRYGFQQYATKTSPNGVELVLVRSLTWNGQDRISNYPLINLHKARIFLLSIYPKFHTRLFPDSILQTEDADVIQDVSHANSIHKVYLAAMKGLEGLQPGDVLVIYRTADEQGAAYYRSVATTVCVVEEVRNISSFATEDDFLRYCRPFSVFDDTELKELYKKRRYPTLLRFTFNISLKKRPNRKALMEQIGLKSDYWGFFQITRGQFLAITKWGEISESLIVDQA
jgi:hypothetical protein